MFGDFNCELLRSEGNSNDGDSPTVKKKFPSWYLPSTSLVDRMPSRPFTYKNRPGTSYASNMDNFKSELNILNNKFPFRHTNLNATKIKSLLC